MIRTIQSRFFENIVKSTTAHSLPYDTKKILSAMKATHFEAEHHLNAVMSTESLLKWNKQVITAGTCPSSVNIFFVLHKTV